VFGVQLVAASGANAIGVISDETKRQGKSRTPSMYADEKNRTNGLATRFVGHTLHFGNRFPL
jgi:hypothetical protein